MPRCVGRFLTGLRCVRLSVVKTLSECWGAAGLKRQLYLEHDAA